VRDWRRGDLRAWKSDERCRKFLGREEVVQFEIQPFAGIRSVGCHLIVAIAFTEQS
jgi:hypothetical protein